MNVLNAKRGRVKSTLTNIGKYVETINEHSRRGDIQVRLTRLEAALNEFYLVIDQFNNHADQPDFIDQTNEVNDFEERYYEYHAILQSALDEFEDEGQNSSIDKLLQNQTTFLDKLTAIQTKPLETNLPKLNVPLFGGDRTQWKSFADYFIATIHKNSRLSNVQKFNYLHSSLIKNSEAEGLIHHISVTDANYLEAWDKLSKRYDHKGQIVTSFIKSFMDQPTLNQQSASGIRQLCDKSDEVIRGLRALGDGAEHRDNWLVFIILNKLDIETRKTWCYEHAAEDYPTFNELIDFLNRQAMALEINNAGSTNTTKSNNIKASGKSLKTYLSFNNVSCPICQGAHRIYICDKFKTMDIFQRRQLVSKLKLCFNCLSAGHSVNRCNSQSSCRVCNKQHHTFLHSANVSHLPQSPLPTQSIQANEISNLEEMNIAGSSSNKCNLANTSSLTNAHVNLPPPISSSHNIAIDSLQSILPTAIIKIKSAAGHLFEARALLDSGSEVSFISQSLIRKLGIPRKYNKQLVNGVANAKVATTKGICNFEIICNNNSLIIMNARILPKLTGMIPSSPLQIDFEFIKDLHLADPSFMHPNHIDVLIGVDYFFDILLAGKIQHNNGYPFAQETIFGWVIGGKVDTKVNLLCTETHSSSFKINLEMDIDRSLQRFWEIENISAPKSLLSSEEQAAESHFLQNFSRTNTGRFIVRLPFKYPEPIIGNSLQNAIKRHYQMERRFNKNENLRKNYSNFMTEYRNLNHMEVVPYNEIANTNHFYLPHHAVFKHSSSTTKIRVVFDGSCKSAEGNSLNDVLLTGPMLQDDIFTLLVRFRCNRFAFTADAEKMYRQVLVHPEDRNYQRIVWRENPSDNLIHFRLKTVTYGTSSGSYLAIRALQQLARHESVNYPRASKIVLNDFYVDDMLSGVESEEDAVQIFYDIVNLLAKGGFNLRKWASNCKSLMQIIPQDFVEPHLVDLSDASYDSIKVLGICWIPSTDIFTYKVQLSNDVVFTMRKILSDSAKIFDPLGWAAPVLVRVKILFQQLWVHKLQWDDEIPADLKSSWVDFRQDLKRLENLKIPRWLPFHNHHFELHAFCDASEVAYSAVVYCRSLVEENVSCNIISAKTRVAPLKQISLPRLELSGALLLCQLVKSITNAFKTTNFSIYAWTDSTIVLAWLSEFPRSWKTFVANRCSEILDVLPRSQWNHIESGKNPADCASRGICSDDLLNHNLWWHGPNFLHDINFSMHSQKASCNSSHKNPADLENERKKMPLAAHMSEVATADDLFLKFSSWTKLVRVIAYCHRFINNALPRLNQRFQSALSTNEIAKAQITLLKLAQTESFKEELTALKTKRGIKMSSNLISLTPFIGKDNLIRVGGRIHNSLLDENAKHPIVLSHKHPIANLIVQDTHQRYFHAGPTFMFTQLKQHFHILGARNLIRKIVRLCPTCRRYSNETTHQIMANLPSQRMQAARPFSKVGCDFAGPITLRTRYGRNAPQVKGYIALYVCLATKAIHLEAVSDLSADSFIACFKRFCGRRGIPSDIYSDNGTNFVGAKKVLSKSLQYSIDQHRLIADNLSKDGTNWHFIPPSAPHFGGIWEAGVKSTKFHLKRVVNNHVLTFEELSTLLSQIEAVLNSRPLCLNPDDDSPLTPAHFLIGQPLTLVPEPNIDDVNISRMSRWQLLQSLNQGFWKRWHSEYLTSLQQRVKWRKSQADLKPGDVVILKDPNLPPGKWSLGKVETCHPGDDCHTRVVVVKCKGGSMKRPIHKLIKLFPDDN